MGEDGGLYGGGSNEPPPSHREAALAALERIQPLSANGTPDPDGRVGFISVGISNTNIEFRALVTSLKTDEVQVNPSLVVVNGARGGQDAEKWATDDNLWRALRADLNLSPGHDKIYSPFPGPVLSPEQVQVAWVKLAARRAGFGFAEVDRFHGLLVTVMQRLRNDYPNLRVVYLSSRAYGGYAQPTSSSPEPHAYEGAFGLRRLIQQQIEGDPELNFDPSRGPALAPVLLWGPYLWADGLTPRSDGLIWTRSDFVDDGLHPSLAGARKVVDLLVDFFSNDELGGSWFLGSS